MSKFKPSVRLNSNSTYLATLPAPARSKGWDILHDIQDHVIQIDRDSGRTQLEVWTNEGYPEEEAGAILTVAVYCAINTVQDLIAVGSLKSHIRKMSADIELLGFVPNEEFSDIYLQQYLNAKIRGIVTKSLSSLHSGYRLAWFDEHKQLVVNAKRSIEYIPFWSFAISPVEKSSRIKQCTDTIEVIEYTKKQAAEINGHIAEIHKDAKVVVESFLVGLDENPYSLATSFDHVTRYLELAAKKAQNAFDALTTDFIPDLVKQTTSLAPIESKSK